MAMASTPATHIRSNSPRILPSFIPGSNFKSGKVFPWNAASNYVKLQVGSGGFPAKPLVRKPWMKRATILRCATTEEIEAEKSLIEKDAKGRMEKAIETLRSNFMSIRTGRANPAMLDRVENTPQLKTGKVGYYAYRLVAVAFTTGVFYGL